MRYNRLFLFLFCVLVFALSSTVSAQTQKHNLMVGGNGSYTKRYIQATANVTGLPQQIVRNTINLNPTLSYFIIDNLAVGFSGNFQAYKSMDTENRDNLDDGHSYSLGPIIRYYFPFEKWAIFPEAQFLKRSGKSHSYGVTDKITYSNSGSIFKLGVGAAYFITPNVGLEGLLNYTSEKTSYNLPFSTPNVSIKRNGINLSVGIQFYFSMLNKGG